MTPWDQAASYHAGKAKAKDTEKKAPAAEKAAEVIVEAPEDAGEGQTAAEREEAEQEEAGAATAKKDC